MVSILVDIFCIYKKVEVDVHEWLPDKSFKFKTFEEVVELTNDFLKNEGAYPQGETKLWTS
jgi:hypothetical protein